MAATSEEPASKKAKDCARDHILCDMSLLSEDDEMVEQAFSQYEVVYDKRCQMEDSVETLTESCFVNDVDIWLATRVLISIFLSSGIPFPQAISD
jgi:hypothetical protein